MRAVLGSEVELKHEDQIIRARTEDCRVSGLPEARGGCRCLPCRHMESMDLAPGKNHVDPILDGPADAPMPLPANGVESGVHVRIHSTGDPATRTRMKSGEVYQPQGPVNFT